MAHFYLGLFTAYSLVMDELTRLVYGDGVVGQRGDQEHSPLAD
jgi:hypothetical protein